MKKQLFFSLLMFVGITFMTNMFAQTTPEVVWAERLGGTSGDSGYSITTDTSNNVYTTGQFTGTSTFGGNILTSVGPTDIFLVKTNAAGTVLWATQFGGTGSDTGRGITTDTSGNVYITGQFSSTATFGSITLTSAGSNDIFVVKLDTTGMVLWASRFGGTGGDIGHSITTDTSGNVYITGEFRNTITFGSTTLTSAGVADVFTVKLDAATGTVLWATKLGGTGNDISYSITVDVLGNTYVTGQFAGTAIFGSTTLISAGGADVFVVKFDTTGTVLWVSQFGGTGTDAGRGIVTDTSGNIYITGSFIDTVAFGSETFTSAGSNDAFVAKLNATGTILWASQFGDTGNDVGRGITIDTSGNVYVTGEFRDTVAFDFTSLTSVGNADIFATKLDTTGTVLWATQFGGTANDFGFGMATDTSGNTYVTGDFNDTADFGGFTLVSAGSGDVFIVKIGEVTPCEPTMETFTHMACDSYTWIDGVTYTESNNTATYTEINEDGCDNVITLDLTINYPTTETFTHTACDAYIWIDGVTYTESNNTATFTEINENGCDHIITLDLIINNSTAETFVHTSCDTYTWIDGIAYTESNNTATFTETNEDGCENVITLALTIISLDNTISQSGAELTANQEGATYQWFYNDNAIEEAISQSFTATENGVYFVVITLGECSVTSEDVMLSGLSIGQNEPDELSIYPNPVSEVLYVTSNTEISEVSIFNMLGQKLNISINSDNTRLDMSGLPTNNYILNITIGGVTKTIKIVKH